MNSQRGQTLIETVVALFIMTMGIVAALGLATYSFNASSVVKNQLIGIGLAREGVEAFKNMRDTNWLQSALLSTDCYNFEDSSLPANCRRDWLTLGGTTGYTIASGVYYLYFDATSTAANGFWKTGGALGNPYGLNSYTSGEPNNGLYTASASTQSTSGFYRRVFITVDNSTAPFNQSEYSRVLVQSQVWWRDKKCPDTSTWPGAGKCSVELDTYLTNWKTY